MVFLLATACKGRSKKTLVPFVWLLKKKSLVLSPRWKQLKENKTKSRQGRELFSRLARETGTSGGGEKKIEPNGAAARENTTAKQNLDNYRQNCFRAWPFFFTRHTHSFASAVVHRSRRREVIGIGKVEKSRLPPRQRSPVPRRAPLCVLLRRPGGDRVHITTVRGLQCRPSETNEKGGTVAHPR